MPSGLIAELRPLLHPILVHFPIALLFASVALDLPGYLLRRPGLTRAGFYALVLGTLGAGVAALAGPDHVPPEAAGLLASHEAFALVTVVLAVALVAVRFVATDGLRGLWALGYLACALVLLAAVGLTGYYGGEMTYHQGVGVTAASGALRPLASAAALAGGDEGGAVSTKPITALLGLLSVAGLAVWLLAGRNLAPNYFIRWWRAARRVGMGGDADAAL